MPEVAAAAAVVAAAAAAAGQGWEWPSRVMFGEKVLQSSVTVALDQRRVNTPERGDASRQIASTGTP